MSNDTDRSGLSDRAWLEEGRNNRLVGRPLTEGSTETQWTVALRSRPDEPFDAYLTSPMDEAEARRRVQEYNRVWAPEIRAKLVSRTVIYSHWRFTD